MTVVAPKAAAAAAREPVHELLAAYERVRAASEALAPFAWVRAGDGAVARRLRVPLPRLLVGALLRHHLTRSVGELVRRHNARVALDPAPALRERLAALESYQRSIAAPPVRRLTLAFVLAVLLAAFVLSDLVFRSESDTRATAGTIRSVITVDRGRFVDAVAAYDPREILGGLFILALSLTLVLWLPAASCRLKRLLLSSYPREPVVLGPVTDTGAYELERRAFAEVGARPPSELRLDRIFHGAALALPLWVVAVTATYGTLSARGDIAGVGTTGGYLIVGAAVLLLLWVALQARSLARAAPRRSTVARYALPALAVALYAVGAAGVAPAPAIAASAVQASFGDVRISERREILTRILDVTFSVRLSGPSGNRLRSRYELQDANTGRVFATDAGPAFSPAPRQMTAAIDTRSLLLLRPGRIVRRASGRTLLVRRAEFRVPVDPARSGRIVLVLTLFDDRVPLTRFFRPVDLERERLAKGRFRTVGKFASATVRG